MPLEPNDGTRFAEDMRRIREARHLTVGDLHDETKIPRGLIEAFEERALFDHPQFNRVYLRSFVRTYAQVVEVEADVALEGLEEALSGRYAGSLAVAYLDEDPESAAPADDELDDGGQAPASGASAPEKEASEVSDVRESTETDETESGSRTSAPEEDEEHRPAFVSTTQATAAGFQKTQDMDDQAEEEDAAEWTAQSPPSPAARESSASRSRHDTGLDRRWVLGIALVVVVGILVWILSTMMGGSDAPSPAEQAPMAQDTTEVAADPAPAASPVAIPTLGDSMNVRIVAARGKVDPIRVTVDQDLRRPYWIEMGDSMTFHPTSRIVIEELLDSIDVKLEGIGYPTSRRDAQGRVIITRDSAQSYFASLGAGQ